MRAIGRGASTSAKKFAPNRIELRRSLFSGPLRRTENRRRRELQQRQRKSAGGGAPFPCDSDSCGSRVMASTFHVYFGANRLATSPKIRRIETADCFAALAEGFDDALEMPTYPAFLGLFYALAGVAIVSLSSFVNALQLVLPLAAGFALVGPFVAIGLYEMSRRRELGLAASWTDSFAALRSPALPSILAHGLLLFAIFMAWIDAAQLVYVEIYGPNPPADAIAFFRDVVTTSHGWLLIAVGGSVGFCFAALALCLSVISFPLLLEREVGLVPAIGASLRLARNSPAAVALWGAIVAATLVFASLPLFIGPSVAMPMLGHATWRLYRRAVEREARVEPPVEQRRTKSDRRPKPERSEEIRRAGQRKTHAASIIR